LWALFLWCYQGILKGSLEIKKAAFPLPLIVFFILAVFYTFHSIDFVVSRVFLLFLISYIIIFFLVTQITSRQDNRWILWVVVILGILTCLYGLYQYLWGFRDILGKINEVGFSYPSPLKEEIVSRLELGRVFSTFLLPSHFAAFLGITIPLSTAFVLTNKGWLRYLFGIAVAVQVIALYLTKSFSGWLALLLACACFILIYLGYIKRANIRYLAYSLGSFFLVLVLIFAGLSMTRQDNPLASISNNPLVLRVLNWETTINMISDSPWIGKGLDTFGLIYPSYQRSGVNIVHHSHNTYLQLGVEMGIIGTIALLWFACWWLWNTICIFKKTRDKKIRLLSGSLMVAGMAFLIHNAFDFEFYMPSVALSGFTVLAVAVGIQKNDKVYKIAVPKNRRSLFTIAGFIAVLMAFLLLLIPFYGQMYFQKARSLLKTARYSSSWTKEAAADLRKAIRLDPFNSEYHYQYGVLLAQRLSSLREGIAEVHEATRLSPWRHYYHFDLGMIYLAAGERNRGLTEIKRASQLYPLNGDYHQCLKTIYLRIGEKDLASQEEQWIKKIQTGEEDQ
jgi:hypothetical protein